jgi:hypothetical protein
MTLYKKEGRRYIPVQDTEAWEGLENGCWMVKVENGSTQIRKAVEPNLMGLKFAALIASQKICDYLISVSEARIKNKPLTKKQKKIVDQFYSLPDKDKLLYWEYESYHKMAEDLLDLILKINAKN